MEATCEFTMGKFFSNVSKPKPKPKPKLSKPKPPKPKPYQNQNHTKTKTTPKPKFKTKTSKPVLVLVHTYISSSSERPGYSELNVRIVRNQLNALHVRCTACHETNIERGQWENHDNICPEKDIPCTSADNRCSWHGPRHSLAEHLRVCLFEALRPSFDQLKNDSRLTTSKLEADVVELQKNVTFLLNIINHGDLMQKSCRNLRECVYHDRRNRMIKFPCTNCPKDVAYNEVSLHTCSGGGYICYSCVESQYPSNESDSSADTSGEGN